MGRRPSSCPKPQLSDLRRIYLQSEMRGLSDLEKAVKLRQQTNCTRAQAIQVCAVHTSALRRAEAAAKDGRTLGTIGRPTLLSKGQEDALLEMIKEECQSGNPPGCTELCHMVGFPNVFDHMHCTWALSLMATGTRLST
jgi:hypothetical protein